MSKQLPYEMNIRWSDKDQCYIVFLPQWTVKNGGPGYGDYGFTHGATYEEAARNGHELLESLEADVRSGLIAPPKIPA